MSKPTSPFSFLNSINGLDKENLFKEYPEDRKKYAPFIINRSLSYFPDTIMFANEMNGNYSLDHQMQYDFLRNAIRPGKRFAKWIKSSEKNIDATKIVSEYYNISSQKASGMVSLISKKDLKIMKETLEKGGVKY